MNFNVIGLDRRPRVFGLAELLAEWLRFASPRCRRLEYRLERIRCRLHLADSLLTAYLLLCHDIDFWTHGDGQRWSSRRPARVRCGRCAPCTKKASCALHEEGVVRHRREAVAGVQRRARRDGHGLLPARRPLHAARTGTARRVSAECIDRNVSIIVGGPYNSGLLATDDRRRATYNYKPAPEHLWQKAQSIRRLCEDRGVDPHAAALRHPAVAAVISGVWNNSEVYANLELFGTDIPDALWRDLAAGMAKPVG